MLVIRRQRARKQLCLETSSTASVCTTLERLPHELLLRIFSYLEPACLTHISEVSRAWAIASGEDELWQGHVPSASLLSLDDQEYESADRTAFCNGALRTWGVSWKVRHELMQTAHRPWVIDCAACQRVSREYEFMVDLLDIVGCHLWGSAEASWTNNGRLASEASLYFDINVLNNCPNG
uniref:F-box domain-containing protein n=1 Tax=Coccolithus braarudii TaxID=221442 RepID=A0A7S0LIQ4_9EUKA